MTSPTAHCPECSTPLPSGALGQRCPACLLQLAMLLPSQEPAEGEAPGAPLGTSPAHSTFFGDYELLGELARGGMGIVYRARQLSLNRQVALKMLNPTLVSATGARLRFQIEAEAVARLDHPHIVALYEAGVIDGQHFLAMRLVEGPSLAENHPSRPAGSARFKWAARLMISIARAVHYAHERGVLHRDLKPSNVLLDAESQPFLTDFGLAKLLDQDDQVTRTESTLGSPNYMAPEQASGRSQEATTAADVYGLGAILYDLLVDHPPFRGATPLETLRQVTDTALQPPRALNPSVPKDLDIICQKCLDKDPVQRYATAAELATDLELWLQDRPIHARPLGALARFTRWCRRQPFLAAASLLLTLALLVVGIGAPLAAWRINLANQRNTQLLTRTRLMKVEEHLQRDESDRGLALLAQVVRNDPDNEAARLRLASVLSLRQFPRPAFPPWRLDAPATSLVLETNSQRLTTFSPRGWLQHWSLPQGRTESRALRPPATGRITALSPNGSWAAMAGTEGGLWLWDLKKSDEHPTILAGDLVVEQCEFDNPSKSLLVLDSDGRLQVFGLEAGRVLARPSDSLPRVSVVHWLPDGRALAVGCRNGTVGVWDLQEDRFAWQGTESKHPVMVLKLNHRGDWLATGDQGGNIRLWQTATGTPRAGIFQQFGSVRVLSFSLDDRLLATATTLGDKTVRVWNLNSSTPEFWSITHKNDVSEVDFSPDGRLLATCSNDRSARIWSLADHQPVGEPIRKQTAIIGVRFGLDASQLITADYQGAVVWNLAAGQQTGTSLPHSHALFCGKISPTGRSVAVGGADGLGRLWPDWQKPTESLVLNHTGYVVSVTFSADGQRVATAAYDNRARVWDVRTGAPLSPALSHGSWVSSVDFDPSGKRLLTASHDSIARVWDIATGTVLCQTAPNKAGLQFARLSADGTRIVTASQDLTARVWSAADGQPLTPAIRHASWVDYAEFSPDGRWIATASRDHTVGVYDAQTGRPAAGPFRHSGNVRRVKFSPDGRRLASASEDLTARIWSVSATNHPPILLEHQGLVVDVDWSPNGRWIVTASDDHTGRIWDSLTGDPITEPLRHNDQVTSACFGPQGDVVLTTSYDRESKIWPLPHCTAAQAPGLADLAEWIANRSLDDLGRAQAPRDWVLQRTQLRQMAAEPQAHPLIEILVGR